MFYGEVNLGWESRDRRIYLSLETRYVATVKYIG